MARQQGYVLIPPPPSRSSWIPCFILSRMDFHFTTATCCLTADLFRLEVALLPCGGVENVTLTPHAGFPIVSECSVHCDGFSSGNNQRLCCSAASRSCSCSGKKVKHHTDLGALKRSPRLIFTSPKGGKLLRVLREVDRAVEPVQPPRRQVTSRQLLVFVLF